MDYVLIISLFIAIMFLLRKIEHHQAEVKLLKQKRMIERQSQPQTQYEADNSLSLPSLK